MTHGSPAGDCESTGSKVEPCPSIMMRPELVMSKCVQGLALMWVSINPGYAMVKAAAISWQGRIVLWRAEAPQGRP